MNLAGVDFSDAFVKCSFVGMVAEGVLVLGVFGRFLFFNGVNVLVGEFPTSIMHEFCLSGLNEASSVYEKKIGFDYGIQQQKLLWKKIFNNIFTLRWPFLWKNNLTVF